MARRQLGPSGLAVAQAVLASVPETATGLLVACSGGADSLALALGAAWVAPRLGLPLRAVVVDHGLQPNSAEVAAAAAQQLSKLKIPASVAAVNVIPTGEGTEAAARDARYRALTDAAGPGEVVLLGHTLDDQAETVLLGLARGSGIRSLAGMAPRRGPFVRPLLRLRRAVTEGACAEAGITPWQDPHNTDPAFTRVRVRTALADLDGLLGPGLTEALARTALLAREDADLLDELAAKHRQPEQAEVQELQRLHPALLGRVVRAWLVDQTRMEPSFVHVASVSGLVTDWHGQLGIDVPGGRVVRRAGRLTVLPPGFREPLSG